MSRTYTVDSIWDLDEDYWCTTFNEPSFGPSEPFLVGDLSFEPINENEIPMDLPMEFDSVETLQDAQPAVTTEPNLGGFLLGSASNASSQYTTINIGASVNSSPIITTPSKNEIAELRYNFFSSPNYLSSIRQEVLIIPQQQSIINTNNFNNHSSHMSLPKTEVMPLCSNYNTSLLNLDHNQSHCYKPPSSDLPSPNMMYSVSKYKDSLAALDMDSFNEYIAHVTKYRTLSIEEKDEIKIITRRIKNREAARRSRREKKDHVFDLEKEVKHLKGQVEHLRMELASLRTENTYLKNEIQYTTTIINSNPTLAHLFNQAIRGVDTSNVVFTSGDPDQQ